MSVTEGQQNHNVQCKKCQVEVAIVENLFWQKPPIYRPLKQKLATKLKWSTDVGDGIIK